MVLREKLKVKRTDFWFSKSVSFIGGHRDRLFICMMIIEIILHFFCKL